jgi:hypothetical protein
MASDPHETGRRVKRHARDLETTGLATGALSLVLGSIWALSGVMQARSERVLVGLLLVLVATLIIAGTRLACELSRLAAGGGGPPKNPRPT